MKSPCINYVLVTEVSFELCNPGDVWIAKGIEYLLRRYERSCRRTPSFQYINFHNTGESTHWERAIDQADAIIVCGVPQLEASYVPEWFGERMYGYLRRAKDKGIYLANLWPGFVWANQDYTREESISRICATHGQFIKDNFSLYDLIISRDSITRVALDQCGVNNTLLPDCVIAAPLMYPDLERERRDSRRYDIITIRNIGGYNERIAGMVGKIKDQLSGNNPCYILASNTNDFFLYKELTSGNDLICVSSPADLVRFYAGADRVVSFRVHGSIMALQMGAAVMNIAMDSRSDIIETFYGINSPSCETFANNPKLKLYQKVLPTDELVRGFLEIYKKPPQRVIKGQ